MSSPNPLLAYFRTLDDKRREVGLEKLTPPEKVILLVRDFYAHIAVHGIVGYYMNPDGNEAVELVAALDEVGASEAAAIVRECNEPFPKGSPPHSQTERGKVAVALDKKGSFPDIAKSPNDPLWDKLFKGLKEYAAKHFPR